MNKYLTSSQLRQVFPTIVLAIVLTIVVCVIATGGFFSSQKSSSVHSPKNLTPTESVETMMQCAYTDTAGSKATISIDRNIFRADTSDNIHLLAKDNKVYIWTDTMHSGTVADLPIPTGTPNPQGFTAALLQSNSGKLDIASMQNLVQQIQNCSQKEVNHALFYFPKTISFQRSSTPLVITDLLIISNIKKLLPQQSMLSKEQKTDSQAVMSK